RRGVADQNVGGKERWACVEGPNEPYVFVLQLRQSLEPVDGRLGVVVRLDEQVVVSRGREVLDELLAEQLHRVAVCAGGREHHHWPFTRQAQVAEHRGSIQAAVDQLIRLGESD